MSTVQALSAPQGLSMPTAKKIFAFASMCVGMFIALIDIQIVSASLRDIGGGLSAADDETVWVQTSYLIAEIIIIPLSGWLARVMSTRWLFAASAAGFTLMSLLCGWAWNIQSMIAFRALQGLAGGSMIPGVHHRFRLFSGQTAGHRRGDDRRLGSLAPTLGPTVGGWITENYNWHWLFFINVVPGIYIAVAVPLLVKVDSADPTLLRGADYLSILLLALSLGCPEYTLEEGPRWGWFDDATLTTTARVALLCGVAFVIRTLRHPQPVMDLRALQDRTFSLGCYFSFMAGVGIFATIYLTPLYLGSVRGFSALEIGPAVFSTGLFRSCLFRFIRGSPTASICAGC
ncbi:DHA2 family efflux MFS transporter permease subunit [Klebsiella pneumoniae]|uniref:DHA2 family efflux MFS transporter permease subunit n=1 Tax=Klebsiella pneumoniae TaxID=573 RepID=A0A5C2LJ74_KLEPN|nr:DHA2 family efflux MFS transporter permease subunit [Klebsiella pneumoniae]